MGVQDLAADLNKMNEEDVGKLAKALSALGDYQEKTRLREWIKELRTTEKIEAIRSAARSPTALVKPQHPSVSHLRLGAMQVFVLLTPILAILGGALGYTIGFWLPPLTADFVQVAAWFTAISLAAGVVVGVVIKFVRLFSATSAATQSDALPFGWEMLTCGWWGAVAGAVMAVLWWFIRSPLGIGVVGLILGLIASFAIRKWLFARRASAALDLGISRLKEHKNSEAGELFAQAAKLAHVARSRSTEALALRMIAASQHPKLHPPGDWNAAATFYALAASRCADDKEKGECLNYLGVCLFPTQHAEGDWNRAGAAFADAAVCAANCNDKDTLIHSLSNLAACLVPANNTDGAWTASTDAFGMALDAAEKFGAKDLIAKCLHGKAFSLIEGGSAQLSSEARILFEKAAIIRREIGDADGAAKSESWTK